MRGNEYFLTSNGSFIDSNELYHWGIQKGQERPNHKYIEREWKNGRWVYTYSQPVALSGASAKSTSEKTVGQNYSVSNKSTDKSASKPKNLKQYVNKLLNEIDMSSASEKLYYFLHPKEKKEYEERNKRERFPVSN